MRLRSWRQGRGIVASEMNGLTTEHIEQLWSLLSSRDAALHQQGRELLASLERRQVRRLLSGRDLRSHAQPDLSGLPLHAAVLTQARLHQFNFTHAELRHAQLDRAFLTEVDFSVADLRQAVFHRSRLLRCRLVRARLNGADFTRARLSGCDLASASLRSARFGKAQLSECSLQGADLGGAHLQHARLRGVDLRGADLRNAHLPTTRSGMIVDDTTRWPDVGPTA